MMNPSDVKDLVISFNNGDPIAFKYLYNKISPELFVFVKKIIGSREEAEDVITETFFKLWKLRESFESIQNINAFLFVTSKNACFDRIRHKKMEKGKREALLENILRNYEDTENERELTELLLRKIYLEIEKLPSKSREVIKLSYIDDLKNAEIARRLGTNEKTIRNQKASALKRLRMNILNNIKT
jgi:RNA polymerase sigma-70 factor (family 1)